MLRIDPKRVLAACLAALGLLAGSAACLGAETQEALLVTMENVSGKVGERTVLIARIVPRAGYKIADAYRNRVGTLSAEDQGVAFEQRMVAGAMENEGLVFKIPVTLVSAGAHGINGVARVAFVNTLDGDYHLEIKSVPLTATITGVE